MSKKNEQQVKRAAYSLYRYARTRRRRHLREAVGRMRMVSMRASNRQFYGARVWQLEDALWVLCKKLEPHTYFDIEKVWLSWGVSTGELDERARKLAARYGRGEKQPVAFLL